MHTVTLAKVFQRLGAPLERVLPPFTSNVADILRFAHQEGPFSWRHGLRCERLPRIQQAAVFLPISRAGPVRVASQGVIRFFSFSEYTTLSLVTPYCR